MYFICSIQEHKDNLSELGRQLAEGSIPDGAKAVQFFNLNFGGVSPCWNDCVRVARSQWVTSGFLMARIF